MPLFIKGIYLYAQIVIMKIQLWSIGKNHEPYVKAGVDDFTKRISKYFPL